MASARKRFRPLTVLAVFYGAGAIFGVSGAVTVAPEAAGGLEALKALYERPETVPFPAGNPYTPEKAGLGRRLFFDSSLSGGGGLACAGCHRPEQGFEDGLKLSRGESGETLERHTPTLWNLAWSPLLFWDGRAMSLEEQLRFPIESPIEMNRPMADLVIHLQANEDYRTEFASAFPDHPVVSDENVLKALATFERTLVSPAGRFDDWIAGDDAALTAAEIRGFEVFNGAGGCAACHSGWAFTDHAFHDTGLPDDDLGRGAVLGVPAVNHAFKTPTLRDIALRAPYMHDGSLATLEEVVRHYETGIVRRPTLSADLKPISLTDGQRADLIAFLEALTSPPGAVAETAPALAVAASGDPAPTTEVSQRGKRFDPGHVAIRAGAALRIKNDDTRTHNVRIFDPKLDFNSGAQPPGQTVELVIPEAGTYYAFCGIHPTMELVITAE